MASTINASTSPAAIVQTADGTAILALQTGNTTALTIDASQNVGIGTASPSERLRVQGAGTSTTKYSNLVARFQTNGSGYDSYIQLSDNVANSVAIGQLSGATYFIQNGTESMRINSSGALLINRTTQLNSERFAITGNASSQCMALISPTSAGYDMCNINNSNGQVGLISTSGSSTTYATSSDYRLKEDIVPMVGALNTVAALKPVTYKWKVDGSDGQGFIAHELQEVVPQAVTGEKDAVNEDGSIKAQGVDTSFLVATLTAAIQEQQAIITSLTARITALEGA